MRKLLRILELAHEAAWALLGFILYSGMFLLLVSLAIGAVVLSNLYLYEYLGARGAAMVILLCAAIMLWKIEDE